MTNLAGNLAVALNELIEAHAPFPTVQTHGGAKFPPAFGPEAMRLIAAYKAAREALARHETGETVPVDDLLTPDKAWNDLCEKGDCTSPEDYPDHCLITKDELEDYMSRAIP